MTENAFTKDSIELKNILLQQAARFSDEIDKLERSSDDHTAYYAYLKDFLINSGILCDDIMQAIHNDIVLLALVGTRTLLEDAINIHYLESRGGETERMATANSWFKLSNDPEAYKNKLDNKSVYQRAKEAGEDTEALHDTEYADFCNYTHSTAQRSILNMSDQRAVIGNKAVIASIQAYANILTCVARITGGQTPPSLTDAVKNYFDRYRASIAEASLPALASTAE